MKGHYNSRFEMDIEIPYGKRVLKVNINEDNVVDIVYPNPIKIRNEIRTIGNAIERPIGSKAFDEFLDDDLLIIVNDATRPTPTHKVLDVILDDIKDNSKFLIATGSHRAPTEKEYNFIFGDHYKEIKDKIHVHDSKNDEMVYLGNTKKGTPIHVNKMAMDVERIIIIGSIEPHYFAGYTGGRKSILPGISSYETIEKNHKYAVSPKAQTLTLKNNPVHEDMEEAAKMFERSGKEIFGIMTVVDLERKIYSAKAGDLFDSFYAILPKANDVFCVEIKEKADIAVSIARSPMDMNLYQSQKALDNAKYAVRDGGIIILVSQCTEGIGARTFVDFLSGLDHPHDALNEIEREFKLGYQKVAKIASLSEKAEMWAVTDLDDNTLKSIFIRPFHNLQDAVDKAIEKKGKKAKFVFLMDGGNTIPICSD